MLPRFAPKPCPECGAEVITDALGSYCTRAYVHAQTDTVTLDLLLDEERCCRCDGLMGRELCGRLSNGQPLCLACARAKLSAQGNATYVPAATSEAPRQRSTRAYERASRSQPEPPGVRFRRVACRSCKVPSSVGSSGLCINCVPDDSPESPLAKGLPEKGGAPCGG